MVLRTFNCMVFIASLVLFISCEDSASDPNTLGGGQSAIGEEGNSFWISGTPDGVAGASAIVTELSEGISTITYSAQITDDTYLGMASGLSSIDVDGSTVTLEEQYRITTEGMESIYDEGRIILVKYDAKVGDTWTLKRGSGTLRREVSYRSTEDEYFWGGMLIKIIEVTETGRNIPGVSDIVYYFNHNFGIVGVVVNFEDGTNEGIGIYSNN